MTTLFQICPASFSRVDSSSIVNDSMNLTRDFLRIPSLNRKVIISICSNRTIRTCVMISWKYVYASKKSLLTYFACCCSMASMRGVGITNQRTAWSEKIQNCDQLSSRQSTRTQTNPLSTFMQVSFSFCRWRSRSLKVCWSEAPSVSDQPGHGMMPHYLKIIGWADK